jgi:hypothetical protein
MLLTALWMFTADALAQDPPTDAPAPAEEPAPTEEPAPAPAEAATVEAPEAVEAPRMWKVAALPLVAFSSDTGPGGGFYALYVRKNPEDPNGLWKMRLSTQLYATSRGYRDHWVKLDVPNIFGSSFRWDIMAGWERWDYAPYYGYGNNTDRIPPADIEAQFGEEALKQYYYYKLDGAKVLTNLRRNLGGDFDLFMNYYMRFANITPYENSLLNEEQPLGVGSGLYTRLSVGVMLDTRNTEPTPTKGMFSEVSVRASAPWTASVWDGAQHSTYGVNLIDRRYFNLVGDGRVVLANRVIVDMRWGEDPFYMQDMLGGSQWISTGGNMAWRGYSWGRFRGDAVAIWTPELRTKVVRIGGEKHGLEIMAVPFMDLGRVWLWEGEEGDEPSHLHLAGGLGTRWIWDKDMVIRADIGFGREEFQDGTTDSNMGIYLTFDHPF